MGDSGSCLSTTKLYGKGGPSSEGAKFAYGTGEAREHSEGRVLDVFDGSIRPGMSGKHGFSPLYGFE